MKVYKWDSSIPGIAEREAVSITDKTIVLAYDGPSGNYRVKKDDDYFINKVDCINKEMERSEGMIKQAHKTLAYNNNKIEMLKKAFEEIDKQRTNKDILMDIVRNEIITTKE